MVAPSPASGVSFKSAFRVDTEAETETSLRAAANCHLPGAHLPSAWRNVHAYDRCTGDFLTKWPAFEGCITKDARTPAPAAHFTDTSYHAEPWAVAGAAAVTTGVVRGTAWVGSHSSHSAEYNHGRIHQPLPSSSSRFAPRLLLQTWAKGAYKTRDV